jgi:hypothetical protein
MMSQSPVSTRNAGRHLILAGSFCGCNLGFDGGKIVLKLGAGFQLTDDGLAKYFPGIGVGRVMPGDVHPMPRNGPAFCHDGGAFVGKDLRKQFNRRIARLL